MNKKLFLTELKARGIVLSDEQFNLVLSIMDETLLANEQFNLTAIKDKDEFLEKMVFDSALALIGNDLTGKEVLDFGTGAGFPGLILYAINPSIKLTLLDSNSKKIHYLNELCKKYNLNIKCVNSRGEEYSKLHKEEYDFVIARAVTQLNILMEISTPLIKVGGCLIAMKGLNYEQEINLSKKAFKELNCSIECIYEDTLPSNNDKRAIIYIKKNGSTKLKYPRDYSTIKRKPL